MNSRVIAATTPGRASGSTIVAMVLVRLRPHTQAASSSSRWICSSDVLSAFTVSGMNRATKASARIQIVPYSPPGSPIQAHR
jgi:hypothetical protein